MFSSLRARLWLSYALVIATALAVVTVFLLLFLLRNPYLYRQTILRLGVADGVLRRAPLTAGQLTGVAQEYGVRALLLAPEGGLMEDSEPGRPALRLPAGLPTARTLATVRDQAGRVWLYTLAQRSDGNWLLVAAPRPGIAPVLAVLTDDLSRPIAEGGVIALLLALVLAFLLARWIADPLQRLLAATRGLAARSTNRQAAAAEQKNVIPPVQAGGPHEVRELTTAFNAMLARVEASQRSQRDLVANVSHELKTPLTSIQGFAQALLEGAAETPLERQRAAEVIHQEAARMHRMVVDLLDLARLDAGTADIRMESIDIGRLVSGVVDRLRPTAAAGGIRLGLEIARDLPRFAGDQDRLAQVFTNLLDNALKFTPRNGQVLVKTGMRDGELEVSVSDDGPGISKDDLPHIFERFYQSDAAREGGEKHGTGLGLAIAQEIISAHGGRITVRSTPGSGAEFDVRLPVQGGIRQA